MLIQHYFNSALLIHIWKYSLVIEERASRAKKLIFFPHRLTRCKLYTFNFTFYSLFLLIKLMPQKLLVEKNNKKTRHLKA